MDDQKDFVSIDSAMLIALSNLTAQDRTLWHPLHSAVKQAILVFLVSWGVNSNSGATTVHHRRQSARVPWTRTPS